MDLIYAGVTGGSCGRRNVTDRYPVAGLCQHASKEI